MAQRFVDWAKKAIAELDQSDRMLGFLGDGTDDTHRYEFELQIGHCLLGGKPIAIVAPQGTEISDKLRSVADAIEFFTDGDEQSVKDAVHRALTKIDSLKSTHKVM